MDRKGLEQLIFDTYSIEPDYPWMDTPESAVFRRAAAGGYREPEM